MNWCGTDYDDLTVMAEQPGTSVGNWEARKRATVALHDFATECQRVLGTT